MKIVKKLTPLRVALATALAITACGGGGGGSTVASRWWCHHPSCGSAVHHCITTCFAEH